MSALTERERMEYLDGQLWDARRLLEERDREIERLRQERDEWEDRYEDLLSSIGGVSPG